MKIVRAKVLGYCMGVRRAVETAQKALETHSEKKIFTLGPLIHNPVVLSSLEEKGLMVLKSDDLTLLDKNSVVVIRAHGTTPKILNDLEKCGACVLDATCPRVHLSQKRAGEFHEKGFSIVLAGDRNHGEVVSISSYANDDVIVIENAQEAMELKNLEKCVLIAQTTFSPVEFEKITSVLKEKVSDLQVFNSICSATLERQNALGELKDQTDGILVIGGKTSANTRRLYETASSFCKNVALIENASEIPDIFYSLNVVGLTAGASTPDSVINDVEKNLLEQNLGG